MQSRYKTLTRHVNFKQNEVFLFHKIYISTYIKMKLISLERSRRDKSFGVKIFKVLPFFDPFTECKKIVILTNFGHIANGV